MITLQQLINNTPRDVKDRAREVQAIVQKVTAGEKQSGGTKIATLVFTGSGRAAAHENWWTYAVELYPNQIHANIFGRVGLNNPCWVKCSCFTGDTLIPLADGRSVQIKDLVGLEEFFVYSKNTETDKIAIGRATNCEVKERNAELVEVEFDNGSKVKCTPDHRFLLRDGRTYKEAKDLVEGESLSALYRQLGNKGAIKEYEQVLQDDGYQFTHKLADEYNLENNLCKKGDGAVRHHKDFNKYNNSPRNIQRLHWLDHYHLHHEHMRGDGNPMRKPEVVAKKVETDEKLGYNNAASERMKASNPMDNKESLDKMMKTSKDRGLNSDNRTMNLHKHRKEGWKKKVSETQKKLIESGTHVGTRLLPGIVKKLEEEGKLYFQSDLHRKRARERQRKLVSEGKHHSQLLKGKQRDPASVEKSTRTRVINTLKRHLLENGKIIPELFNYGSGYFSYEKILECYDIDELIKEATNHKVVSVRKLTEREDVYCFTVDKYENFVIDLEDGKNQSSGVVVHNCPYFHFFMKYSVWKKDSTSITTKDDAGAMRPATVRNPGSIPGLCKHLIKAIPSIVNRSQQLARRNTKNGKIEFDDDI